MADNVRIPATGTGDATPVVATDEVAGAHHQLIKVEFGADGAATLVSAGNPLPTASKTDLTPAAPTAAAVGVASAQAVAANASRTGLVLTNTSANVISLGLGAAAVLNSGITLDPGAIWAMNEYTFTTAAIFAIAAAAGSNLAIQEFA